MMISHSSYLPELPDWECLSLGGIELSPAHIQRAVELSQTVFSVTQQWQTYLQALALFGFEEWLAERAPDLTVQDQDCSLLQPAYANLLQAVCNLTVGLFRVCLIVTGDLPDSVINLPRAAIELPAFVPDLYVWVNVREEQMQVEMAGYLRGNQLDHQWIEQQQAHVLSASDWNYDLPLDWFNPDPTALLFDLRCLEPAQIAPAAVTPPNVLSGAQIQARLTTQQAQLQSPTCVFSQVLTWNEAATILTDPDLSQSLYQIQNPKSKIQNPNPAPINVGLWFRDRLDQVAQELAWVLMPVFTPVPMLRSIGADLQDLGIQIPASARGAYRNLQLADVALRFYAITWLLPTESDTPEWNLLVVLKAQPDAQLSRPFREQRDQRLPLQTQLQVYDDQQLLQHSVLEDSTSGAYLYAQVAGTVHESFRVAIAVPDHPVEALPPFIFCPSE